MSCSRVPGPAGTEGVWPAARTPGPLGFNDHADPNICALMGDTPGVLGWNDAADPNLPRLLATQSGVGQAAVKLDDGTVLAVPQGNSAQGAEPAPWMTVAQDQARQHKGALESNIQKKVNYHKEVGTGQASMVGTEHAWCAAFVNWCLAQAGIDIDNESFADHVAAKGRAHAFFEVRKEKVKKGEKQASLVRNPLFIQIEQPVYGAVAMVTNPGGHGKHVGFVYSKPADNTVVLLGGNQADTVKFSDYNIAAVKPQPIVVKGVKTTTRGLPNHLKFFLPQGHEVHTEALARRLGAESADALNDSFGIAVVKKKGPESDR